MPDADNIDGMELDELVLVEQAPPWARVVLTSLKRLEKKVDQVMSQQSDLDAAVNDIAGYVTNIEALLTQEIAAVQSQAGAAALDLSGLESLRNKLSVDAGDFAAQVDPPVTGDTGTGADAAPPAADAAPSDDDTTTPPAGDTTTPPADDDATPATDSGTVPPGTGV